ncbi:TonB-dependent receptor [Saprospiraceae bacterium]|nr:TonB-dependent receptor [Saprospiraceae bacterium]
MKFSKITFFTFLTLIFSFSIPSFSQTETESETDTITNVEIQTVVVAATRTSSSIENTPLNIGIITKRQIEENLPVSPVEALQYEPGVTRQSDGGLASTPIIRGLSRERAPVLIDGNPFVGGRIRSFSLIDPFQIERIELVKGPASAFWGSDAVAGLVNIVTRKAESGYGKDFKIGGSVYAGFNSNNEMGRGRVEFEGRGNGFDFLIGGGMRNASNTNTPEGEIENSQFESQNFDFNIGYSPKENHRIELSGKYFQNDNVGFPGGLGAPGPPIVNRRFAPDTQTAINLAYDGKNISDKVESIGARLFFKKQDLHIDQVTNVFFPMTMNANRVIHAKLDVDVPFMGGKFFTTLRHNEKAKLTVGVDYLREHRIGTHRDLNIKIFNPLGVMVNEINKPFTQIQPDSYSSTLGIFAIEEIQVNEKLGLLLAARFDNVSTSIDDEPFDIPSIADIYTEDNKSDSDNAFSGNLGIKFKATKDLSLTANLANSFRGTDLFSKYHFTTVGQGFLVPNPDLNPEKGIFYELGVKYDNKKITAGVNFYQNFLSDLFVRQNITFDSTASVQWQNIGEATMTGVEWNFKVKFGTLSHVFLSGAYIKGENDVTGNPLPEIPALQNWLGVHFRDRQNKFFVQAEALFVGEQTDIAPNEIETPSYTVVNLKGGVNLHNMFGKFPHTKLMLSMTNIADEAYRSHVSRGAPGNQNTFLEAGRSFNIGIVTRFGAARH